MELNAAAEDVDIEVLEEGNKGIFGLLGSKTAKVRVSIRHISHNEPYVYKAKDFLCEVLHKMNIIADVECYEEEETITLSITGSESGVIIGRRGETLDSLQYLTSLVVNRNNEVYKRVVVDIENYRQKREETLTRLADSLADRVIKYRRNITLEPMNPYERRIIHASLQDNRLVKTYSVGEEPNRKVVIALK